MCLLLQIALTVYAHLTPFPIPSASVRRGYQVYKDVCSACHSMNQLAFRNLIGVSHTEEEVRAIAEEVCRMQTSHLTTADSCVCV